MTRFSDRLERRNALIGYSALDLFAIASHLNRQDSILDISREIYLT